MTITATSIHEDGSVTVRRVPGRIVLDTKSGKFSNPESAPRPNVRVSHTPATPRPTHTFKSSASTDFREHNGPVTVIRPLSASNPEDRYDDEVGPMFRVLSAAGVEFDAFGDELTAL